MKNDYCDCEQDGLCPRYGREMRGRLREICQGVNVDAGTAQIHREHWAHEAKRQPLTVVGDENSGKCSHLGEPITKNGENVKKICEPCGGKQRQVFACNHPSLSPHETTVTECASCEYRPKKQTDARVLILRNHLSPGDVLVMSASIHSLHRSNPGKFLTAVDTTADQVYEHNPDVISIEKARELGGEDLQMHYPSVHQSNERGITFMQAYCEFLSSVLKVNVPLLTNRPHVYLSKQERSWMDQVQEATGKKQKFWLICAGRKNDYTTKFWGTENFQRVVDSLRGKILFVQVGSKEHHHPPLKNVLNLIGKTDARQLIRLCWHAEGVLSGVTFLQHLAAAMQKPSVVIMGGREPVTWNTYPRQQLIHTVGMLSCCKSGGCWRSRVEKLNDGSEQDSSLCENPVIGDEVIPKCMALIQPKEIAEKILLCT